MSAGKQIAGTLINLYLRRRAQATRGRSSRRGARAVELYFQADDPYSYLLAQVVPALRERHGIGVETIAVPPPDADAAPEPALRARYAIADARELARYYDLAFPERAEPPDPALARRAGAAVAAGADPAEVGAALWSGDAGALDRDGGDGEAVLAAGAERLRQAGHYMGGTLRLGSAWFWGVDRLGLLERALGAEPSLPALRPEADWPVAALPAVDGKVELDYYLSFRSPYSYLALERTYALARRFDLRLRVKPVLPMVSRGLALPRAKRLALVVDAKREADRLGVPFGRICDPLGPGVERCLAMVPYAREAGRLEQFLVSSMRGIWAQALEVASDRGLRRAVEGAGLSWTEAQRRLGDDAWRAEVERNRADLTALGLWGVPSFRLGDYRAWGQDRLWIVEAKLARAQAAAGQGGPRADRP